MAIEKLLEEVGKEIAKETLDPNEKLLKESVGLSEAKEAVKIAPDVESAVKISELDAAKNYFTGIGDTEKLNALEGTDEVKKEEALMEAKEKSAEVREAAKVEDKLNGKSDVSFGSYILFRERKCKEGRYPTS